MDGSAYQLGIGTFREKGWYWTQVGMMSRSREEGRSKMKLFRGKFGFTWGTKEGGTGRNQEKFAKKKETNANAREA